MLTRGELAAWSGHDSAHLEADALSSAGQTDYERACAVADYIAVLPVAGAQAVVLGDEPLPTAWVHVAPHEGIFVRWVSGEDQEGVPLYLKRIDEENWESSGILIVVGTEPLYLFDAAWPGMEATEHLVISLSAGSYEFETVHFRVEKRADLLLHRVRRH